MAATDDIILDENSDFINDNGDFKTGANDNNLIYYNIVSHEGHYRTAPLLGFGLDRFLNANVISTSIERDIKSKLAADIFPRASVDASNFPEIVVNKTLVLNVQ